MNDPGSAMDWTIQMALDAVRKDCDENNEPDAMVIILLYKPETEYRTSVVSCGLEIQSDTVVLLERVKNRLIAEYTNEETEI